MAVKWAYPAKARGARSAAVARLPLKKVSEIGMTAG